jgi:hypothetical protein
MIHHRRLVPVAAILLALHASPSIACLNDTAVRAAEDEFRSRYQSSSSNDALAPSSQIVTHAINPWGVAGLAVGSGLVSGSCVVGFRRQKRGG